MAKKPKKKLHELYISAILVITVLFLTIGFSAVQTQLLMDNLTSSVRVQRDVRITSLTLSTTANGGSSSYEAFQRNIADVDVSLPNSSSTVTYNVIISNLGNVETAISTINGLPENLKYTLNNYSLNNLLCDDNNPSKCTLGTHTLISLTIGYTEDGYNSQNTDYSLQLEFDYCYLTDAIARVENTLYNTLQDAINAVPLNTQTNVELLQSTSECVSVAQYKNIVFNFNNNTLSNSDNDAVITNKGTIVISNGTLTSDAATVATINNDPTGVLTISGGSVIQTGGRQALYNNSGGNATITGTAYLTSSTTERATVHNLSNGTLTITGGTIVSTGFYGIQNAGTMTVGIQDGTPNRNLLTIQGYTDGIYSTTNYGFYDGEVKGRNLSLNPKSKANSIESGYSIVYTTETINGVMYIVSYIGTGVTVTFNANGGSVSEASRVVEPNSMIGFFPEPTRSGYTYDGWSMGKNDSNLISNTYVITGKTTLYAQYTKLADVIRNENTGVLYDSMADAISAVPDNTPTTLTLLKDTTADLTIGSDKIITINLSGYTIQNIGNRPIFESTGTLRLANGDLDTTANQAAINAQGGTLIIDNCSVVSTGQRQAMYITGGSVTVSGSSYFESKASGKPGGSSMERGTIQVISGTLIITGGRFVGTGTQAVSNEGTVIIGVDDGVVDATSPELEGKVYGLKSTGQVYFYDGILKGKTAAYNGTITGYDTNYTKTNGTDGAYKTFYLS